MMVSFSTFLVSVLLALSATTVEAAPTPFEKRVVGSLSCHKVKSGTLTLYNTKTKATEYVTVANKYTVKQLLADQNAKGYTGNQNAVVISSYPTVKASDAQFEFLACKESQRPGFEDFPAKSKAGTYYGHLSPIGGATGDQGNPALCAKHQTIYSDDQILTAEKCNYSDDSGSPFSYFSYKPSKSGQINFLGYTGPKGAEPETADQKQSAYDFSPGTSAQHPAVYVHDGSPQFSDWILRLQ